MRVHSRPITTDRTCIRHYRCHLLTRIRSPVIPVTEVDKIKRNYKFPNRSDRSLCADVRADVLKGGTVWKIGFVGQLLDLWPPFWRSRLRGLYGCKQPCLKVGSRLDEFRRRRGDGLMLSVSYWHWRRGFVAVLPCA